MIECTCVCLSVCACVRACVKREEGGGREKKERRELIKEEWDKLKMLCPTGNNDETK